MALIGHADKLLEFSRHLRETRRGGSVGAHDEVKAAEISDSSSEEKELPRSEEEPPISGETPHEG